MALGEGHRRAHTWLTLRGETLLAGPGGRPPGSCSGYLAGKWDSQTQTQTAVLTTAHVCWRFLGHSVLALDRNWGHEDSH